MSDTGKGSLEAPASPKPGTEAPKSSSGSKPGDVVVNLSSPEPTAGAQGTTTSMCAIDMSGGSNVSPTAGRALSKSVPQGEGDGSTIGISGASGKPTEIALTPKKLGLNLPSPTKEKSSGSEDKQKLLQVTKEGSSPLRNRPFTHEPLLEENGEEGSRSTRSGSAGTLSAGGFPTTKRASLHHGHGRKLTRRSSFLVDTACSRSHTMIAPPKPPEPVPPPVVSQTRRCSLTLPYPNLYGSWQAAAQMSYSPPASKTSSNEISGSGSSVGPPPLLKRKSFAHFDLTGSTSSRSDMVGVVTASNFRRLIRPTPGSGQGTNLTAISPTRLEPSPEEEGLDSLTALGERKGSGGGGDRRSSTTPLPEVTAEEDEDEEELPEPYLLAIHLQKLPMKDFVSEVRASMDIEHFLHHAVLLLDIKENSVESVVDLILSRLIKVSEEPHCTLAEVKSSLFAHDSGTSQFKV